MRNLRWEFLLASMLTAVASAALVVNPSTLSGQLIGQKPQKSLDIRRYADEPLELIDLKIRDRSFKSKIHPKYRIPTNNKEGLDTLDLEKQDDWFKDLSLEFRNVSGKRITGLTAYFYLKPVGAQIEFSTTLVASSGRLQSATLEPGAQIELIVDRGSRDRTLARLKRHGFHATSSEVTFSIGIVAFSDGLQWRKGRILERDPANPYRWKPIPTKSPPERKLHHEYEAKANPYLSMSRVRPLDKSGPSLISGLRAATDDAKVCFG